MATSTTSASSVSAAPPAAGSTETFSALPFFSTAATLLDRRKVKPWRVSRRWVVLGDLAVHAGQDAVEELDHRHLGAEPPPDRAEFQPDDAGADDHQARRHLRQRRARRWRRRCAPRRSSTPRSGAESEPVAMTIAFRLQRLRLALVGRHGDLAGRGDGAGARDRRRSCSS